MQLAWSQGLPIVSAKPDSWRPWVSLHWEQQGLPVLHELGCKAVYAAALDPAPINALHTVFMMRTQVTSWSMWGTAPPTLHAQLLSTPSTSCNGTAELACSCFFISTCAESVA